MSDLITISSSVLPPSARVVGFRGTEQLSRPYHFEIYVQMRQEVGEEFDLADAIGATAKMVVDRGQIGFQPFIFAGVFANVEVLHAYDGQILVRALLVPRLWQLGLSRHSRIFTKIRVPDILTTILEENGITDYELRLGAYETEEHVCQYRESDLDFISRWMEKEGIFYFFEHTDDGEKLVLVDDRLYDEDPLKTPVRYFPQVGHDNSAGQHFRSFTCVQSTLPTSVRLKDYDYAKPNLPVVGRADVQANGAGEVSLYGERFFTPTGGDRYARIRAEELLARQAVYHAAGTRYHLRPGYVFELDDHPFPSFNARYLTVEARHSANQAGGHASFRELMKIEHGDVYQVEVDAIPAKTQFRAESLVAWPRIYGYENGVVDGPAESEYAQIDDMGRYNAKFKFDESALRNGKATTWVRMMQPHGGDVEGFHFPLRKGTEVVFCFLGGDCDRPVIFGIVPNAVKPSPVVAANHTRNVIQTGGRNRVEMEDLAGGQWMHLSTPASSTHLFMGAIGEGDHNFILETQGTGHIHTHDKLNVNVEGIMTETVVGDVTEQYDSDVSQTIDGHKTTLVLSGQTETVLAGFTQTILAFSNRTILGPYTQLHAGPHTQTHVGEHTHVQLGAHTNTHVGPKVLTRTGSTTNTLTGNLTETINGTVDVTVNGSTTTTRNGSYTCTTNGATTKTDNGAVNHTTSGSLFTHKMDNHLSITGGAQANIFAGAQLSVTAGAEVSITAAIKLSLEFGAALDLNSAVTTTVAPFAQEATGIKMHSAAAKMAQIGAKMHMGGVHTKMLGLFGVL